MYSLTFHPNTTPAHFAKWLFKHTATLGMRSFPVGRGRVGLGRSSPQDVAGDSGRVMIGGYYAFPDSQAQDTERHVDLGEVIYFDLTSLAAEGVEVKAACDSSEIAEAVRPYWRELLTEIARTWPEARVEIAPYLKQLAAEMGESQPPEPGTPEAAALEQFTQWAAGEAEAQPAAERTRGSVTVKTNLIEAQKWVNIWNEELSLGLVFYGARNGKAVWLGERLLTTAKEVGPSRVTVIGESTLVVRFARRFKTVKPDYAPGELDHHANLTYAQLEGVEMTLEQRAEEYLGAAQPAASNKETGRVFREASWQQETSRPYDLLDNSLSESTRGLDTK